MYQYTFDEDTTTKIKNSQAKTKTVFDQFSEVDNKYNTLADSNQTLDLEKIDYIKPTENEVKLKAENNLYDYKNANINSINDEYAKKTMAIDESIQDTKESGEKESRKIKNAYSAVKEEAKDDAIKRGLARSSIIVNTLNSYDKGMLEELSNKTNEINSKIEGFQNEKNLLEAQKQNALNSFDIAYAVKLQEEINGINEDIEKKEKEVIEYNNKIAQIQAQWEKDQQDGTFDKATELADLIGEYGSAIFEVLKQNEKFEIAKEHFANMPKDEALEEFKNNSSYITNLGKKNYNILLEELESRE